MSFADLGNQRKGSDQAVGCLFVLYWLTNVTSSMHCWSLHRDCCKEDCVARRAYCRAGGWDCCGMTLSRVVVVFWWGRRGVYTLHRCGWWLLAEKGRRGCHFFLVQWLWHFSYSFSIDCFLCCCCSPKIFLFWYRGWRCCADYSPCMTSLYWGTKANAFACSLRHSFHFDMYLRDWSVVLLTLFSLESISFFFFFCCHGENDDSVASAATLFNQQRH